MRMPWYYDKKDLKATPSSRDGIPHETEKRYRAEGARFIIECGKEMSLGHNTVATGVVYFHRFYMVHSFRSFPRYVTACCCLFLAGKVEETPKKCKDIIKTAKGLLTDVKFQSFGDDPKEEVMTLERILLQTIKFDLQVDHPYGFLVKYAKSLKGDQAKLQKLVQMAWNFVNDSLSTTICLQWEPEVIGIALIHLASKLSKFTISDWNGRQSHHLRWWDMFVDVEMEVLEDICHQMLDFYQKAQANTQPQPESPPQLPPSKCSPPMRRANPDGQPPPPLPQQQQQMMMKQGLPIKSMDELRKESMGMGMAPIPTVVGGGMKPLPPPPQPPGMVGGMDGGMYGYSNMYGHYGNGPPLPPMPPSQGNNSGYYPPPHSGYYPPP